MRMWAPKASKWLFLLLVGCVVISLFIFPIKLNYSVTTPGKVIPAKKWVVSRGTDGRLISSVYDYKGAGNQAYSVAQFERGDAVRFSLKESLEPGQSIFAGDTVAAIHSNDFERQVIELERALVEAEASLRLYQSGEKAAVVEEANQTLMFAKKQAEEEQRIVDRLQQLHENQLISKEEYESARGKLELSKINVQAAEARLASVKSGAKSEQIDLLQSRISLLERELATLNRRWEDFTLISPVSGSASQIFASDTILVVNDTTEFLVLMPVRLWQRKWISTGQAVEINASETASKSRGQLINLDGTIRLIGGRQMMVATAAFTGHVSDFPPGLMVDCRIHCEPISVAEYVRRMAVSFLN